VIVSYDSVQGFRSLISNRNIQYSKEADPSMFKTFRDKVAFSGITVLIIGLALLVITFASAYSFLSGELQILATSDIAETFGGSLSPLIATSIRVMYLGVMGWIGSLVTIRGVTIIANTPKPETASPQKPQEILHRAPVQPQQQRPSRPVHPEMVVIPLEEMEQRQTVKPKSK
jgi:hypothetical protein